MNFDPAIERGARLQGISKQIPKIGHRPTIKRGDHEFRPNKKGKIINYDPTKRGKL